MPHRFRSRLVLLLVVAGVVFSAWAAWTPLAVKDDPVVRMPGTQPDQGVNLEGPRRCFNCHGDYNPSVEPGRNWKGSLMAQAARDPIFWACLTVAAQDSVWALGNPNATDLCLRCHFPEGWLGGRSDPTNASLMTGTDFDGIHCDFCHRMYDPFAKNTYSGDREGDDWTGYWDEAGNTGPGSGTLSQDEAQSTRDEDLALQGGVKLFSGAAFFVNGLPRYATYTDNGSGQYFVSGSGEKRASFADAGAKHKMLYSRYHKSMYFCGTCHDVSNPALAYLTTPLPDQSGGADLISEQYPAGMYFHVERTFSEFLLSAYGRGDGAATRPEFREQGAPTILWAAKCQDCHMRDVSGLAANKDSAVDRPAGSAEHPASGQPLHDLTGGNAWISDILASLDPAGPAYDPNNVALLDQGRDVLTLDLSAGESPAADGWALMAGSDRAKQQLRLAATIKDLLYDPDTGDISFRIQNNTAHKLISGFPEGRRMFLSIEAYADGQLIYAVNPYDQAVGTLKGLHGVPDSPELGPNEVHVDELVYEVHPSSTLTDEHQTFHFVLATGRGKDNRIPPKGFDIERAATRYCEPVWHGRSAPDYFTAEEYAAGCDDVALKIAPGADFVVVALYYQGTSREYVAFLRDEINGTATTLPPEAYIAGTDPFFSKLRAWGNTIWQLWLHNHGLDGSGVRVEGIVPLEIARATFGDFAGCPAPIPTLQAAVPDNRTVTLTWSDEHTADPLVVGYCIYYDQAGKAQYLAEVGTQTSFTDTTLTNGQLYCYKVTSIYADCESAYSNVRCATPDNPGQQGQSPETTRKQR